jgi:hypothetical protein
VLAAVAAALKDDEAAEEPPAHAAGAWDGLAGPTRNSHRQA